MNQTKYLYVIGLGDRPDFEAGRGIFYCIEDSRGEKALPVFTALQRAESYMDANFNHPDAHLSMLESAGADGAPALTEGRFVAMPLDEEGVATVAAMMKADYLIRDPRPGDEQEILRLDK